jgi:hypothetical protein
MRTVREVRVDGAQLRMRYRIMVLLVLLLTPAATVRVPSVHAAQTYSECVDEAWKDYNICLVKGKSFCDLKFLFNMSVCAVVTGPDQ